jgi:hypothetical protein
MAMATTNKTSEFVKARVASHFKSLELLYDYTKFHIGLYLTLTASYITVASVKLGESDGSKTTHFLPTSMPLLLLALLCFVVAGLAAGIIASSITQFSGGGAAEFLEKPLGPWKIELWKARTWTYTEHTAFWVGLFLAAGSVLLPYMEQKTSGGATGKPAAASGASSSAAAAASLPRTGGNLPKTTP